MITDPRLLYATTTANPNPLAPESLVQQQGQQGAGTPQIPTGLVETTGFEQKIKGAGTAAADRSLLRAQQDTRAAMLAKRESDVRLEEIDQQQAEAERDEAERKQRELDALTEQENSFRASELSFRASELARRRQELEDFKKSSTTKTLFQDATPLRRFLSALATGAGQWAATMSGSGRNGAYEIFKDQEDRRAREQEAVLKLQTKKMLAGGKNAEETLKFFKRGHDLIEKQSLARLDVAKKQAIALKAAVPKKAAEIDREIAKIDTDYAEKLWQHENPYDPTKRGSTQESSGDKSAKPPVIDTTTKQAIIQAKESVRSLGELGDFVKAHPEAWKEYQGALKSELQSEAWKSGAGKSLASSAQFFGVMATVIGDRLKTPEARKINALMTPMVTIKAREGDPVGVLNKDAFERGERDLSLVSSSNAEVADTAYMYRDKKQREYDELVSMTPALQQILQQQPMTAARAPAGKGGSPVKAKSRPDVASARSDYAFIAKKLEKDSDAMDPDRKTAFDEAVLWQRSGDPEKQKKAAKAFRILRDELPKD